MIDIDRLYTVLAGISLAGALFVTVALPVILDANNKAEAPYKANIELIDTLQDTKKPALPYQFYINKGKAEAWPIIQSAQALIDKALSIKPPRPFVKPITLEYVGNFYLTKYAATVEQCGNDLGITASGKKVTTNPECWTIAVDPKVIPLGSKVVIEGYEGIIFEAADTGGDIKNYWIDIYTDSEPESKSFNPCYADVWIIKD